MPSLPCALSVARGDDDPRFHTATLHFEWHEADRPRMLVVCIPACEQGTRILSVPRMPSAQFDPVDEVDPCIPWNPALTPGLV